MQTTEINSTPQTVSRSARIISAIGDWLKGIHKAHRRSVVQDWIYAFSDRWVMPEDLYGMIKAHMPDIEYGEFVEALVAKGVVDQDRANRMLSARMGSSVEEARRLAEKSLKLSIPEPEPTSTIPSARVIPDPVVPQASATPIVAPTPSPATFPAPAPAELPDDPNFLDLVLGHDPSGKPVKWRSRNQSNGFILTLGASGSGKTETLKALCHEVHEFGVPVLIFDFHGDVEIEQAKTYVLSPGPACKKGINPMELDSTDLDDGGVYTQVNILIGMIQSCIPSMGHQQVAVIKDAISTAYMQAGISDSNPETWTKKPPTFTDVLGIMAAMARDELLPTNQRNTIQGAINVVSAVFDHPVFNRPEQISLSELMASSHRLNMKHLESAVKFAVADTLLRKVSRCMRSKGYIPVKVKSDHERFRLFVAMDEAKILSMGKNKDDSKAILNVLATEDRKFGLGLILASQMADHFSSETKAQVSTWIILKSMNQEQAEKNALEISPVRGHQLLKLRGHGHGFIRLEQQPPTEIQITPLHDRQAPTPVQPVQLELSQTPGYVFQATEDKDWENWQKIKDLPSDRQREQVLCGYTGGAANAKVQALKAKAAQNGWT